MRNPHSRPAAVRPYLSFPEVRAPSRDSVFVTDDNGLQRVVFQAPIEKHITGAEFLVQASRKVGDLVLTSAELDLVTKHFGQGENYLGDREFTGSVVVADNGVATAWTESSDLLTLTTPKPTRLTSAPM